MALTAEEEAELAQLEGEVAVFDTQPAAPIAEPQPVVPEEPTGLETISKALFPASTAREATLQPQEFGPTGMSISGLKEIGKSALTSSIDVLGLATRGLSAIKNAFGAKEGEKIDTALKTLQDTESGIFKGSREESNAFYENLINETENPVVKGALTGIKFLAEASIGVIEDPTSIVTGAAKVGQKALKRVSKISPDLKASVATASGIEQDVLEAASRQKVKDIRGAAGTEESLAKEISAKISPKGEEGFLADLTTKKRALEDELTDAGVEAQIKQPTLTIESEEIAKGVGGRVATEKVVKDPTAALIDPKSGEEIAFPVDFLENISQETAFTTLFKSQYDKIRKEADQITIATKGKEKITVKDALQMKRQFQQVLKEKFGVEGKGIYDNILKGFTASVRASIETSAIKAGKPEYVDIMREISKNKEFFATARETLTGARADFSKVKTSIAIEKKLSRIMNKFDRSETKVLSDLDEIFTKAGIPSDIANRSNLAAISRKTGIKGKGTPILSAISTGKSAVMPLMFSAFSPAGPMKGLAFMAGMASNSPLAARSMFKSLNWASKSTTPLVQSRINALGKATSAAAISRIIKQLEREIGGED